MTSFATITRVPKIANSGNLPTGPRTANRWERNYRSSRRRKKIAPSHLSSPEKFSADARHGKLRSSHRSFNHLVGAAKK
jgi:hypothetical protein